MALLGATEEHDVASMMAIQLDTVSLAVPPLREHLCALEPHTDAQRDALGSLRAWDGDLRADSHDAALFQAWISAIMARLFADRMGPDLFAAYQGFREPFLCRVLPDMLADQVDPDALRGALDDAVEEAAGRTWGELHTLVLSHPLARIPGLDEVFIAATIPLGGDSQTVAQGGFDPLLGYRPAVIQSVRAVYDLGDLERSATIVPAGVSGNPASPHWADQAALYAAGGARARRLRRTQRPLSAHDARLAGTISRDAEVQGSQEAEQAAIRAASTSQAACEGEPAAGTPP